MRSIVLGLTVMWALAAHAATQVPVFVLHSYSQEYPWTKRQHNAFVEVFENSLDWGLSASVEYLDTKRVPYTPAYAQFMAEQIEKKYRGYEPRLIYVTDDNALSFALDELSRIFPNAPVFFSGVNNTRVLDQIAGRPVTGVFERKEIAPNLALMNRIDPGIRDILVVGDESETFQAIRQEIKAELEGSPGIRAHFISERRIESLVEQLRQRTERFVFLTTLGAVSDATGRVQSLGETIGAIVDSGEFIVFSMEDAYLFPGVLGGYVTSGLRQGQAAAELAKQFLAGRAVADLPPVQRSPNEYLIDGLALRETGRELPPSISERVRVVNPWPSFFERHQRHIVAGLYTLAAFFVLSVLGMLIVLVRKNREILRSSRALLAQAEDMSAIQESLTRAQRIARMGNWDWCVANDTLYWSEGVYRLFGVEPSVFAPSYEGFLSLVHPEDRHSVKEAVERALRQGCGYDVVHRLVRPDGQELIVRETAEILRDAEGEVLRMNGTILDITAQQRTEAALRDSEAKLRTVIQGFPVVLFVIDRRGTFLLSEGKGLELLNLEPGQVVGQSVFELYADLPEVIDDIRRVLAGELVLATRWIGDIAFDVRYSPLWDAKGELTGAVGVAADVTERKRAEENLSFLANYDPVTHLPNRSLFNDRLAQAMSHADRHGHRVGLLFVDLDNFKVINDTLGHSCGDELLRQVAQRFTTAVRASDTVSRLGGDEFTIILEDLIHPDDAARIAGEIVHRSSLPYRLQGNELYVTPSVGIALYPDDGDSAQALLMNADAAMYRAKENGRNSFEFFSAEISRGAQERLELSNLLRGALGRGEFSLHYQPQIDIGDGSIVGFESLLRWRSPKLGVVSPAVFIPILEETGLIVAVGEWVVHEACRWAARIGSDHDPALQIAVNISARQFRHPKLVETIAEAIAETGLSPTRLELEITESSLINVESHIRTMDRIKQMGVKLGIDDFGTGYSSLSYLKRFPIDRLKIDASFVRDVAEDPDDAAIARTVIGLGHSLGLKVIAEGVEKADQLAFLAGHDCDEIQGYLVARPMPDAEAAAWMRDWQRLGWQRLGRDVAVARAAGA